LDTLARPEAAGLRQRLAVRARVDALGLQEAADYLLHHLRLAGGRPERLLADDAAELLARRTSGVPRLLNQAAHQALALAEQAGASQVDVEAAIEALALLGLESEEEGADGAELGDGVGTVFTVETSIPAVLGPTQDPEERPAETAEDAACRLFFSPPEAG
jgi:hypothetical protein